MSSLLILYNPYYQNNVIESHLELLRKNEKVAFGKVKSKLKNSNSLYDLSSIYESTSKDSPLQLFLSDYASLFVTKVIKVEYEPCYDIAPSYYKDKDLEVEMWFIIEDMRELVRESFTTLRDSYLANFRTPHYGNHTYAIYGNAYIYPLLISQKEECNYFQEQKKHYPNIYKTNQELKIKQNLADFAFGELLDSMHPDTLDNIISAEIEYQANKQNPLYDFSAVIVKYSKCIELELYSFAKELFRSLSKLDISILELEYNVQGISYTLKDIFEKKPNLGTYVFLLNKSQIKALILSSFRNHRHLM